jgi:hypothetical protein
MNDPQHRAGAPFLADAYAAGVYGSIIATAFVAALREAHEPVIASAVSLLSTMAVFWLAHVWSEITGEQVYRGKRFMPQMALGIARAEWPLVEAAFGPLVVLLLGGLGLFGDETALTAALVISVLQLLAWGFVVGRRAYRRWFYATLSGLANGVLGLTLVALETIVLH